MPEQKINNLSEFIRMLKKNIGPDMPCWCRGQSNFRWKLLPKIARKTGLMDAEISLIARFKQNATLLSPGIKDEWSWLTIMQHHGAPTRLLDWTESPMAALYFSVYERFEKDGAFWLLYPCKLNRLANIEHSYKKYIPSFADGVVANYRPTNIASEHESVLNPIAVIGPRNTARMQAQQGVFTVIHRNPLPIEHAGAGCVKKFIIPKRAKKSILKDLSMLKVGKFQLFPELQSVGDILRDELK